MTGDEFRAATVRMGLKQTYSDESIEAFFDVSERTARRWIQNGPPKAVAMLIRVMQRRRLKPATVLRIFEETP